MGNKKRHYIALDWDDAGQSEIAILALMGKSLRYIVGATGFSTGQVLYRIRHLGVGLSDYRNSDTEFARRVEAFLLEQGVVEEEFGRLLDEQSRQKAARPTDRKRRVDKNLRG